jgi:glycosyltransferase involved in cell wall biosynthesis
MLVSVIIPTYNRPEVVTRLLKGLEDQSLPPHTFEVIVVDDGSEYEESIITCIEYPYHFVFLRQSNQGATIGRNNGALHSRGEVLVFIDDDVTVSSQTLETLYKACKANEKILATGRLIQRCPSNETIFSRLINRNTNIEYQGSVNASQDEYLHYSFCYTQLLAVTRKAFFELGMIQDPTGGWPNWDDIDFGYRAYLAGFQIVKCSNAEGIHWDSSLSSLKQTCQRWYRASMAAVALFKRHPELQHSLPMFFDKTPIDWKIDSIYLIVRKVFRRALSCYVSIYFLEKTVSVMERCCPSPKFLGYFYRWIQGGYMVRGYFDGLKEDRKSA